MSVQFGRWHFDGAVADPTDITKARDLLSPYAPDGITAERTSSLALVFGAFHTTRESRCESQPYLSRSGNCVMWDGRLDNREDCVRQLRMEPRDTTDLEIVAAAYDRWGSGSFDRLLGDWAVSIWSPAARCLVLARDFLGTRQLYYAFEGHHVTWSTILDPLVILRNCSPTVSEEYAAGWLAAFPKASLTPYQGIFAVPPSSYATIRPGETVVRQHWKFDPDIQIRHRTDREYEEHFRTELGKAVSRRMRSDGPVLAELSGGMDSSSIVCIADSLVSKASLHSPGLDTVSYYDDTEPNWDERPYFTRVEAQRGRAGRHIDVRLLEPPTFASDDSLFLATPSSSVSDSGFARQFSECLASGPYHVLLSGVGGDEVTGGIPTPLPELADLLARFRFGRLGRQLLAWSLAKKKPIFHMLWHVVGAFLPAARTDNQCPSWLHPKFVQRHHAALCGYRKRLKLLGSRPSFQANVFALDALRRQFGCTPLPSSPTFEKRYPYLDRDFLAFCYSLPREQLIRPNQRRSLMRRALVDIVPEEILNRKRKAFVRRRLAITLREANRILANGSAAFVSAALGIIEPVTFRKAIDDAGRGNDLALVPLVRALDLERWLRSLSGPLFPGVCSQFLERAPGDGFDRCNARFLGREQSTQKGGD